jgi:hypothetical protein
MLAAFSDSTASTPNPSPGTSSQGSPAAESANGESKPPLPPRPSSQDIAQVVLAGHAELAAAQSASSPNLTNFSTVLEAHGPASPIQVSIVERKLLQLFKIQSTTRFYFYRKRRMGPKNHPFRQLGSCQLFLYVKSVHR